MTKLPEQLVIASRGSPLALKQAGLVGDLLRRAHTKLQVEVRTVKTSGDRDRRPFRAIGGKGLFTSEVEREVEEGRADVAVHSAKDLTAELAPGCGIVLVPPRGPVHDVVVGAEGPTGEQRLAALPGGGLVGTSSMRRRALLAETRPDLEPVELRGNLGTRLRKIEEGQALVAILAAAGMERLGVGLEGAAPLDPGRWIPAPAQGALAVEARKDRADVLALVDGLGDRASEAEIRCERAFAARLEGGCSVPLGCLAVAQDDRLVATGFLALPDGSEVVRDRISGGIDEGVSLGTELAEAMLAAGGEDILAELRGALGPAPSPP